MYFMESFSHFQLAFMLEPHFPQVYSVDVILHLPQLSDTLIHGLVAAIPLEVSTTAADTTTATLIRVFFFIVFLWPFYSVASSVLK